MSNEDQELYVSRINFLVKIVRQTYDQSQKAKDTGKTDKYNKLYNKYLVFKSELETLRKEVV